MPTFSLPLSDFLNMHAVLTPGTALYLILRKYSFLHLHDMHEYTLIDAIQKVALSNGKGIPMIYG